MARARIEVNQEEGERLFLCVRLSWFLFLRFRASRAHMIISTCSRQLLTDAIRNPTVRLQFHLFPLLTRLLFVDHCRPPGMNLYLSLRLILDSPTPLFQLTNSFISSTLMSRRSATNISKLYMRYSPLMHLHSLHHFPRSHYLPSCPPHPQRNWD